MTKETKIGLLVGLAFIVLFAIILSEKGNVHRDAVAPDFKLADSSQRGSGSFGGDQPLGNKGRVPVDSQLPPIVTPSQYKPAPPQPLLEERIVQATPEEEDLAPLPASLVETLNFGSSVPTVRSNDSALETSTKDLKKSDSKGKTSPESGVKLALGKSDSPYGPPAPASAESLKDSAASLGPVLASATGKPAEKSSSQYKIKTEHVVQPGESLGKIAAKYYGRSTMARIEALYDANRDVLKNPSAVKAKDKIRIPDLGEAAKFFEPAETLVMADMPKTSPAPAVRDTHIRIPVPISEKAAASSTPPSTVEAKPKATKESPIQTVSNTDTPKSAPGPFRVYEVKKSDTLSRIARRELGNERHATEIYKLNRDKITDRNSIRPGLKLKLPAKMSGGVVKPSVLTSSGPDAGEP